MHPTHPRSRRPELGLDARTHGAAAASLALLVLSTLILAGCGEDSQRQDPTPCDPVAVQVQNADGSCEWTTSCDASDDDVICRDDYTCSELPSDVCETDSRCQLTTATACPGCMPGTDPSLCQCTTGSICEEKPSATCADLGEADCIASASCVAEFGWSDGSSSGSSDPGTGGCTPEECGEPIAPEPVDPTWTYLGCRDNGTSADPCSDLDAMTCETHPGCRSVWGSPPCDCAPGQDCACPAVAIYEGCESQPTACDGYVDPVQCDSDPACGWDQTTDGAVPCSCTPGETCSCMEPPQSGTCTATFPVESCTSIIDPASCEAVGCVLSTDGTCQAPQPPTTGCTSYWDELTCVSDPECEWHPYDTTCAPDDPDCGTGGLVAPTGWCGEKTTPTTCADATTLDVCTAIAGCEWIDTSTCDCDPANPDCTCTEPSPGYCQEATVEPTCYDYFDELSCTSDATCQWVSSGSDIVACPSDAMYDDQGICRDSQGVELPDSCCGGSGAPLPPPEGYCEPIPEPTDPCEGLDEASCTSTDGCAWQTSSGFVACDPDAMWGDDGLCYDSAGNLTDTFCCDGTEPPSDGSCVMQ